MSEELALVLAEVERFATRAVEPLAARSELPMSGAAMDSLLRQLRDNGVVASEAAGGLGVWEGEGEALLRSVRVLRSLARASAGVALAAHTESLAAWLAGKLGLPATGAGIAVVHGRVGLGRGALARYLRGAELSAHDRAVLADVYAPGAPRLVTARASFSWAIAPVVDAGGSLGWSRVDRDAARVDLHPHAHGFDELATLSLRPGDPVAGAGDRALLGEALARASLGLVAIALGAAERGHGLARRFAGLRAQGGSVIDRHPAVQLLLASSRQAIDGAQAQLEWVAREGGESLVRRALSLRAETHPLLARAANDALQVFGGLGYMRDTGAEKVLRDVNHLRATAASPTELALVLAEWERLDA